MRIGVPQERLAQETRAAATPKTVEQLLKLGFSVAVESGAGKLASFDDEAFAEAGAEIVTGDEVWQSDVILKVNAPNDDEIALLNPGTTLISFIWPAQNPQLMEKLAARNINVMAMDSVPRISRAQSLDALSSMANIAGYRAIVEASKDRKPAQCLRPSSRAGGDWRRQQPGRYCSRLRYPSGSEGAGAEYGCRVPRAGL